jgi:hypothetical protein
MFLLSAELFVIDQRSFSDGIAEVITSPPFSARKRGAFFSSCNSVREHLPLGIPNKGGRDEVQISKGSTNR